MVLDVQQALLDKNPSEKLQLVDVISRLLEDFREKGKPVIFVRHDDGPGTELTFDAPGWQVAREVPPLSGEKIFDKQCNSAFLYTGLESHLKKLEIDILVITGLQTEYCIDATIKSTFERGFQVLVPAGGVSTFDNGGLAARQINRFFLENIWQERYAHVWPVERIVQGELVPIGVK